MTVLSVSKFTPRYETLSDLAWIAKNISQLWSAAQLGHTLTGRGALVIDATSRAEGDDRAFWYAAQNIVANFGDSDANRMIGQYDPVQEMVTLFLKSEHRVSTYRVAVLNGR